MSSYRLLRERPTPDTSIMQSPSNNESYLAVPMASWETKKRPLESQDAPDTVSSTPKRSCTPENTFLSGLAPMADSHDGTFSVDRAAETTLPLLGVNAESEQPCHAIPRMDTAVPNFAHQPGLMHHSTPSQAVQSSYLSYSTPPRSLSSLKGRDSLTLNNDEDTSQPKFNTCLGLERRITPTSCPLIGY